MSIPFLQEIAILPSDNCCLIATQEITKRDDQLAFMTLQYRLH